MDGADHVVALRDLQDYMNSLVEKRMEMPGDDLISKLVKQVLIDPSDQKIDRS